ncbi:hypothetical protein [Sinanaerobacter chloroacetimidivorans]|uniref:Uncharacterized protein n=1 Tax=Sinanaerobacter chloroacetimidivorans TaxID=2818044 RepID=A0A8J8B087_9FIRM|nr:hypothetical protein [Sinanaerobacter chloroacetimidivorans]MBR0596587.1 hypothetical protein [Sinanaerobacter chloroacetimidivorans]
MYDNLYPKNPKTGNRMIEISLVNYNDFFHEWDNSIFKKRDVHPELTEFLDQCSEEIPLKEKMEIILSLQNETKNLDKENTLKESYKNYYSLYYKIENRKMKGLYKSTIILIVIGFCFMLSSIMLTDQLPESVLSEVLVEGLTIGAWVFIWEALHFMVFERRELFLRRKELKRFLKTPLFFKYKK